MKTFCLALLTATSQQSQLYGVSDCVDNQCNNWFGPGPSYNSYNVQDRAVNDVGAWLRRG